MKSHFSILLTILGFAIPFLSNLIFRAQAQEPAAASVALEAAPATGMFPFVIPWDDDTPSIINLSSWLDAPAGKHGFVAAKNGHLFAGDKRIRFLGVNTVFDTNFPVHNDADKIAAHMAKYGIGCVRLHHMDTRPSPEGLVKPDRGTIDPARLELLDYFIATLEKHGVYVDLNLHVGRMYPGFEKTDDMSNYFKGIDNIEPGMIAAQKQFARDLLKHVNPYTKLAYTDDPGVAFVEINNENSLFLEWYNKKVDKWPTKYLDVLNKQWNTWISAKYPTDENLRTTWKGDPYVETVKLGKVEPLKKSEFDHRSLETQRDWIAFLYSAEEQYWVGMYHYLKDDLQVRSLVVGTPQGWSPFPIQAQLDAIDCHGYWQHPSFPHNPWDHEDWYLKNKPMVSETGGGLLGSLGRLHVAGKPFICTEYMECAPNTYNAETMPLLAAYAAMQDWDAVFLFDYANDLAGVKEGYYKSFFDLATHPAKMATFPAAVAMFVRGDVSNAVPQVVPIPQDQIIELIRQHGPTFRATDYGVMQRECLRHPVEITLADDIPLATPVPSPPPVVSIDSDTKELRWAWPTGGGIVTVNTARSVGIIGFATADQKVSLGQIAFTPCASAQGFVTIQATVMAGADFGSAQRILVTATGLTSNTGLRWKTAEQDSVGMEWGSAPTLAEGISATVEFPMLPGAQAWALNTSGQRAEKIELKTYDSKTVLEIGPQWKTLWYEIEILRAQ